VSRTDAHAPLRIRLARGEVSRIEVHDHTDGVCDLPDLYDPNQVWHFGGGHCRWDWLPDGHGLCSCGLCHCGEVRRRARRLERQQTRRDLRATVLEWNAGVNV